MASKSGQQEPEKAEVIEELLDALDKLVDRVKVLYEQYFLGIQKQPPTHLHSDIERKIRDLAQMQIRNTALRYRYATLGQKFGSYNSYWRRTLRQIESGTYTRNLSKIGRQAARSGADVPEEILAAMPKRMREQVRRDRDAALAAAKRREKAPSDGLALLTLADEDVDLMDMVDVDVSPEELEAAAFVGESTAVRRNVLSAGGAGLAAGAARGASGTLSTGGAHVLAEDDDFDLDAFFAKVTSEGEPNPVPVGVPTHGASAGAASARAPSSGAAMAVPPPASRAPVPPARATQALPRMPLQDTDSSQPPLARPPAPPGPTTPASAQPPLARPPVPGAATPTMSPPALARPPVPGAATPTMSPPALAQPPVPGSTTPTMSQPPLARPPLPALARPPVPGSTTAPAPRPPAPPPAASTTPTASQPSLGRPQASTTPTSSQPPLARPPVSSTPTSSQPPQPRTPSQPMPLAPSQATRPSPVAPGAAAARAAAPVESMAGPFPRIPSMPPVPTPPATPPPLAAARASSGSSSPVRTPTATITVPERGAVPERIPPERTPAPMRTLLERGAVPERIAPERTPAPTRSIPPRAPAQTQTIPTLPSEPSSDPAANAEPAPLRAAPTTPGRPIASERTPPPERVRPAPPPAGAPRPPSARPVPAPRQAPPPGMSDADVNALYASYVKAKEILGEQAGPGAYSKLLKTINAQAPKIMEQYKSKGVDFSVVVKDNQVIIRAKPKP